MADDAQKSLDSLEKSISIIKDLKNLKLMENSKVRKYEEEFEGELDELIAGISKIKNLVSFSAKET